METTVSPCMPDNCRGYNEDFLRNPEESDPDWAQSWPRTQACTGNDPDSPGVKGGAASG
ncbi:hypothetical protein CyaNS01_00410 [Cyanobium sp. NS01]|nr:hypothetical protein CyaNS01_00410 [Cyanobium sp. NS01]